MLNPPPRSTFLGLIMQTQSRHMHTMVCMWHNAWFGCYTALYYHVVLYHFILSDMVSHHCMHVLHSITMWYCCNPYCKACNSSPDICRQWFDTMPCSMEHNNTTWYYNAVHACNGVTPCLTLWNNIMPHGNTMQYSSQLMQLQSKLMDTKVWYHTIY